MGMKRTASAAATLSSAAKNVPSSYGWGTRLRTIPAMMKAVVSGSWDGASRLGVGLSLLGVLYVLSPLDVIPDFLAPFGLVDDFSVAAVALAYLLRSADAYLEQPVVVVANSWNGYPEGN